MTVNSHSVDRDGRHGFIDTISMSKIAHRFLSILVRFGAKAESTLKAFQIARMSSVLSNMSATLCAVISPTGRLRT